MHRSLGGCAHTLAALAVGCCLATHVEGQERQLVLVRGRITDSTTGAPVRDAIVRVPAIARYTLTDTAGNFVIRDVPAGLQIIQIAHLAYGDHLLHAEIRSDSLYFITIAPQPIRLDAIVVEDRRRIEAIMADAASWRAWRMGGGTRGQHVFWRTWNREQIAAAGIDDPLQFLRAGPPHMSIRKCTGLAFAGIDRLCIGAPFGDQRATTTDLMFSTREVTPEATPRVGASWSSSLAGVYIDDRPVALEDLPRFAMNDIYRVENYGYRGEYGVRMYTKGYLQLVSLGIINPKAGSPLFVNDRLRIDPDSLFDARRPRRQ